MAAPSTVSQVAQRQAGTGGFGFTAEAYETLLRSSYRRRTSGRSGLGLALLDEADHPRRRFLDRELGRVDHRASEPPLHRLGALELLVDLEQLRIAVVRAAH